MKRYLKFDKEGNLLSWMEKLPKVNKYYDSNAQKYVKVGDVKRVLAGERKTAAGFIWKEVTL